VGARRSDALRSGLEDVDGERLPRSELSPGIPGAVVYNDFRQQRRAPLLRGQQRDRGGFRRAPLLIELTARGAPQSEGLAGALAFLDQGHAWIVQGFTDITTPEMHDLWKRKQ